MKARIQLVIIALFVATMSAFAYTAQFHAGAGLYNGQSDFSISEASNGSGVTLPTPTLSGCSGWEFAGWVASGAPYEATDELTQELYRAGTVYSLSSISEEFYAVYRYITDRYHEIYVNDQLITGSQYVIVNEYRHGFLYPNTDGLYARYIEDYYNTWSDGYIDIDAPISALDADTRASIPHVLTETNATNNYWSMYNPHTGYYVDFDNVSKLATYNTDADCVISRTGWNTFSLGGATSGNLIGLNIQTGGSWFNPTYTFYSNFTIYRQQTIFTSTPDCSASNYTVTFNAGSTGTVTPASRTEGGYHRGVVLPAATPNTGGVPCNNLWEFAGWTESGSVLGADAAELPIRLWLEGEVYYPERNETLNAVYRRKSNTWEQVEDPNTLQAGEKVLIAYKNGSNYYVLSSAESAAGYNASVTVAAGEMTSMDNAALVWRLEGKKGAWRLKDSNGGHLDMTRNDYACSHTYPWARWSDEFTIAGETDFSIRSNYAAKKYLTANGTRFSSTATANSNIHIYRQVTTYSKTPKCENYTVLFNSGEGTFGTGTKKDSTVAVDNVSSVDGILLSNASVPTAKAPNCDGWKFSGWRVGSGLNATTNAPGMLYASTDTYVPLQDSITLYAVYQQGDGELYYEKVNSKSEITADGTYVLVNTYSGTNRAVTYNSSNSQWSGTTVTIADNKLTTTVTANMMWTYNGTYFYRGTDNTTYRLARNGNDAYAGQVTNTNAPFKLQYKSGNTTYYLRWRNSQSYFYYNNSTDNSDFNIYKQKTDVPHNSWPHCTAFSVVLNSCGGKFTTIGDTHTPTEPNAGDGVVLDSHRPTTDCAGAGWSLVGWVEKRALQARNTAPANMILPNATYHPKQDMDQLYAVYSDGSLWTSYPACGEGIEIVEWTTDGVIVETYTSLAGTPSVNGKNGTANGDGTYTLSYDVASNPCVPLLIQWGTTSQIVKTPLLVNSYTRTSAVMSAVGDCSDCDMVVLNGGTAVADGTQTVRHLSVYPGGRFNLPSGKSFTASSLTMRTVGDNVAPAAVIQGTFTCSTLNHDRRIPADRWYWMALPYDVTIAEINYADVTANGGDATHDEDFYLAYYDGVARAADKGAKNSYWTYIPDGNASVQSKTLLNAGRGYLVALDRSRSATGHTYRTLRFPMTVTNWNSEKNIEKTVVVKGADCAGFPQHIGWNMIGNPFLQNYSAVSVRDVACGKLTEYYDGEGQWVSPWYTLEEGTEMVPYITLYNPGSGYTQTEMIGQNIAPFSAAFVQLPSSVTGMRFVGTAINPSLAPARRMGLLNEEDETSRFRIHCFGSTDDQLTLIVDNNHDADYEVGADLLKWSNNGKTNIYTRHGNVAQVFDALSYADADSIAVGFVQPTAGEMIIGAEALQKADEVEHVWLIDNAENAWTDLLTDVYTLTTDAGTFDNRLWIRIVKRYDTPTEIPFGADVNGDNVFKFIREGQLFIQREDKIYDATGSRVR